MNLNQYLDRKGSPKAAEFARIIGVSSALLYQWRQGIRPVSVKWCLAIEKATSGLVTRRELRQDDWQLFWPELANQSTPKQEASHA
ncbi:transcriptional regulator [Bordetella avium]|uniref:transcriptional regulator n=1 Tax=Bordetella avium TaxID=521 RepID=UPI000E0A60D0|nr:YdaS family helix-turn-helix protein [Bordetella avium]RIQ58913.1 hypothetical protein D0840_16870 [Bordetella avium]WQE34255.1 YdaS family helix-turn-helix protein [Bordetella avium]SUV67848.1 phage protein [Bordetella avium]